MSVIVEKDTGTARAVIGDDGRVIVILTGADAAGAAAEYLAEGYRVEVITDEF